jgi:hypothetical protein
MRVLRVIYVLAIAVALVLLVVAGVQAFYPAPSYPEYDPPTWDYNSTEYQEWEQEWTEAVAVYEEEAAVHGRNIFLIVLPLGVMFAVVGTFVQRRTSIFGAGLILGGIGMMIFAVTPYDLDNIPKFIGIAAILAVLIFVGYKVFISLRKS